jgi:DNA-binding NtrC family response regulator
LDEVDSLSVGAQAKLLRFLEIGEYRPVGADRTEQANVWVLAATNQDLRQRVAAGKFRADLLYRLDVVRLIVPPLCERAQDVLILAQQFLGKLRLIHNRDWHFSPGAVAALAAHDWPGNVRELKNRVEAGALLCRRPVVEAHDLGLVEAPPLAQRSSDSTHSQLPAVERDLERLLWSRFENQGLTLDGMLEQCERILVSTALEAEHNNKTRAAARLGIHVRTIYKKLLAAPPDDPKPSEVAQQLCEN